MVITLLSGSSTAIVTKLAHHEHLSPLFKYHNIMHVVEISTEEPNRKKHRVSLALTN